MNEGEKKRVQIPLSGDERTNIVTLSALVIAFQTVFNEACLNNDLPKSERSRLVDFLERAATTDLRNMEADTFHPDHEINGKKQALLIIGEIANSTRKAIAHLA